jgi:molybdate/tungstate transport system ATP-binding protein
VIRIEGLTVHAGEFRLERASLEIPTGGYGMLMGKTGSGKTTVLEALAGLKPIVAGRIVLGGVDVTHCKPAERNIGYVPQDGALFSTMTVRDHLAFALSIRRASRALIEQRVAELSELLEIGHLLDRSTHGLSGGEKQRVAVGRALSFRPSTLCLDEPLSALDDATREQMYSLLEHVRQHTGVTTLHVTHNIDEAVRLATHVFRIENGHVVQRPVPVRPDSRSNGEPHDDVGPNGPNGSHVETACRARGEEDK